MTSLGTIILFNTAVIVSNTIVLFITTNKFNKWADQNATRY